MGSDCPITMPLKKKWEGVQLKGGLQRNPRNFWGSCREICAIATPPGKHESCSSSWFWCPNRRVPSSKLSWYTGCCWWSGSGLGWLGIRSSNLLNILGSNSLPTCSAHSSITLAAQADPCRWWNVLNEGQPNPGARPPASPCSEFSWLSEVIVV